jgi:hypothetical protein
MPRRTSPRLVGKHQARAFQHRGLRPSRPRTRRRGGRVSHFGRRAERRLFDHLANGGIEYRQIAAAARLAPFSADQIGQHVPTCTAV